MIKKLISIRNVGRFKNSAVRGMPELRDCTFVFGPNGYGKTTIGAVLRSLQTGDSDHILGRRSLGASDAPRVELLLDSGVVTFDGQAWSRSGPPVAIFDGDFVAENIHSGEVVGVSHKRNLYRVIIGEEGVALAARDAELAITSRQLTTQISSAKRAIESHLPTGMSYRDFLDLPEVSDLDDQVDELRRQVQAAQQAQTIRDRPGFEFIEVPSLPAGFAELLSRTIDDVGDAAERILMGHLQSHPIEGDGRSWIRAGLPSLDGGTCPFCGQSTEGLSLVGAFKSVFSAAYRQLADDLEAARNSLESTLGAAAVDRSSLREEKHLAALEFWASYCDFEALGLEFPAGVEAVTIELHAAARSLLERKAGAPMQGIQFDDQLNSAIAECEVLREHASAFNEDVALANLLVAARRAATELSEADVTSGRLQTLLATRTRYSTPVIDLCSEYDRLVREKSDVDAQKEKARDALNKHTDGVVKPYEARINELLSAFNTGFSIAETRHSYPSGLASSSYQLVIDGETVSLGDSDTPRSEPSFKNTLSSGDRTTLALAFFLAHLERDPQLESKVVVFDDPFNSQDAFRRRQTILEIMKVGKRCNQVIVLSHDQAFLKALWEKAEPGKRVALNVVDHRIHGSKLLEWDLEEACRGRTLADLDDLQAFLTTGDGTPQDLIRKLRVVLETHCQTTYLGSFLPNDWLGDIVKKIRDGGEEHPAFALYDELDAINDYTKEHHHGENLHDVAEAPIDRVELTGFVRRTLQIVNASTA